MKKSDKKQTYKLKFDTSQANLSCFIKKKNKNALGQEDKKTTRKKTKSCKEKNVEFQSQPFITSVLTNIFTQDFGEKDIKELVLNSKLQQQEQQNTTEDKNINENSYDPAVCFNNILCTKQYSVATWKDNVDSVYKSLLCQFDQIEGIPKHIASTRINTQQTHRSRYTLTPQSMNSDRKSDKNPNSSTFQTTTSNYNQMYDPYKQFYPNESYYNTQQRKRKTLAGQQNNQFKIYLQKIEIDGRTTLMVRNIPNKYTQQMLVDQLNRNHKNKYNFFYLPIDYNNSCNVGYAFINFMHTKFIQAFYQQFDGRKWNKFNSEKICSLAYARIQGTASLMNHFQYSSLINHRDRKIRPIVQLGPETLNQLSQIVQEQKQQTSNIDKKYL